MVRLKAGFVFACTVAVFCGFAFELRAAEHWLVGKWDGKIAGLAAENGVRDLMVGHVNSDGSLVGRWGQKTHLAVSGRATDGAITLIVAGNGNRIALRRDGDDRLTGTFKIGKRDYPLTMIRAQGASASGAVGFPEGKSCVVSFYNHRNEFVGRRTVAEGDEFTARGSHKMRICRDGKSVFVDP